MANELNTEVIDLGNFSAGERPYPLEYTFLKYDGTVLGDITGASVVYDIENPDETVTAGAGLASVSDGPAAKVEYDWDAADLSGVGRYRAQFWLTFNSRLFASVMVTWYVGSAVKA